MRSSDEDLPPEQVRLAALQTLYAECTKNWVFFLEYRFKFLQTYLLVIGAAGITFAWLWRSIPVFACVAWLIVAFASGVFAIIEYRTGHVLHATRKAGEALESHLCALCESNKSRETPEQLSGQLEHCAEHGMHSDPKKGRLDMLEGFIRKLFFPSEDRATLREQVRAAVRRTPAFFAALGPTFAQSARQGALLLVVYGVGVLVFTAAAGVTLILAACCPHSISS